MIVKQWFEDGSYTDQCESLVEAMRDSAMRHVTAIREHDGLSLFEAITEAKKRVCAVNRVWREIAATTTTEQGEA